MTEHTPDIEMRRLELEERKAEDSARLREKELEVEALKARLAETGGRSDANSKRNVAAISILSAIVGAGASLGAAYLSGTFSVQEKTVETTAQSTLEEQRFSYELINTALSESDATARALRLQFMVDVGLLANLNQDKIREYAKAEQKRIESGDDGYSLLPLTREEGFGDN